MNRKSILAVAVVMVFLLPSIAIMLPASSAEDSEGLPSSFDQRDLGIVTPPKYQNPWGVCWAFGGIAAAETSVLNMLGTTWEESGLDFSERHLSYFSNNHIDESVWPSQAGEGVYLFDDYQNAPFSGAWPYHFSQLYSTGVGPLYEEIFPFKGAKSLDALQMFTDPDTVDDALRYTYFDRTEDSIQETIDGYTDEQRKEKFDQWTGYGVKFPEGVDETNFTAEDVVPALTKYSIDMYGRHNEYYKGDDWSLEPSSRQYTEGYTMVDGNYLKNYQVFEDDKLVSLDDDLMDDIKSEMYKGYGMVVAFNYDNMGYDSKLGTCYQCATKQANHMVQLVGWDDDYPADNFSFKKGDTTYTPEGNGAWLCKNSWGSETFGYDINGKTWYVKWGIPDEDGKRTGYFWLSYYDWSIQAMESMTFTDELADENGLIYMCYDYLPDVGRHNWSFDDTVVKTANVFESYYCKIEAVSITTYGYDSDVTVSVYLDVKDTPESGKLVYRTERTIPYAGIHVLYLDDYIETVSGQSISVVVEERSPDSSHIFGCSTAYGMELAKEKGESQYFVGIINEGESYLFKNGEWSDWSGVVKEYEEQYPGHVFDNFGIKIFAIQNLHEGNSLYDAILVVIIVLAIGAFLFARKKN